MAEKTKSGITRRRDDKAPGGNLWPPVTASRPTNDDLQSRNPVVPFPSRPGRSRSDVLPSPSHRIQTARNLIRTARQTIRTTENLIRTPGNDIRTAGNLIRTKGNAIRTERNLIRTEGNHIRTTENANFDQKPAVFVKFAQIPGSLVKIRPNPVHLADPVLSSNYQLKTRN